MPCQLCENLFTRYELAIQYGYPFYADLLHEALEQHGRDTHPPEVVERINEFFAETSQSGNAEKEIEL